MLAYSSTVLTHHGREGRAEQLSACQKRHVTEATYILAGQVQQEPGMGFTFQQLLLRTFCQQPAHDLQAPQPPNLHYQLLQFHSVAVTNTTS